MKTIYTALIIGILLIGIVVAGELSMKNKEIKMDKEKKDALADIGTGITDYQITDSKIGETIMQRCLFKEGAVNICQMFDMNYVICSKVNATESCVEYSKLTYDEKEMDNLMDEWERGRIEGIADAKIERDKTRENKEKIQTGTGVTTIK